MHCSVGTKHIFLRMPINFTYCWYYLVLPWVVGICEGVVNSKFVETAIEETQLKIIVTVCVNEGGRPTISINIKYVTCLF